MKAVKYIGGVFVFTALLMWVRSPSTDTGDFTQAQVCNAAIATVMSKDADSVELDSFEKGVVRLSYIRHSDNSKWSFRCKLVGNKVIWATESGRWRNGPYDSVVSFIAEGDSLTISERYEDGSGKTKTYYQ